MYFRARAHGAWCNTKTWRTNCKYCHSDVYYFSCDCGSKCFFDECGEPWPVHRCEEYLIAKGIPSNKIGIPGVGWGEISDSYSKKLVEVVKARIVKPETYNIERVAPSGSKSFSEIGQIREIIPLVDVYKKLRVSPSESMARGFLGDLAEHSFSQLTIHVGDIIAENTLSYTCFIRKDYLAKLKVSKMDIANFEIHCQTIPIIGTSTWICDDLVIVS